MAEVQTTGQALAISVPSVIDTTAAAPANVLVTVPTLPCERFVPSTPYTTIWLMLTNPPPAVRAAA